jgi:hypothetical protein
MNEREEPIAPPSPSESPLPSNRGLGDGRPVRREVVILGAMVGGESSDSDVNEASSAAPETERKVRELRQFVPRDLFRCLVSGLGSWL